MVYANPAPETLATGEYYHDIGAYYLSPAKLEADYATVRFQRELALFHDFCPGGAVLDVGCSSGAFLFQLNRRWPGNYRILGMDVSGPALDFAESKGIPVMRGHFLKTHFEPATFEAITFWAVLEHLAAPKLFLEKAAALLKPAGFCFVLVPNFCSLATRLLGWKYRYIYSQHLNYFRRETLAAIVQPSFSIVKVRSTHFNPVVIWQDWRRRGQEVANEERGQLLSRTTAWKQNPLLRPLRPIYGALEKTLGAFGLADNLAMVLQKPGRS